MSYQGRPISKAMVTALEAAGLTVGYGEKPVGGGWVGVAGGSKFVPYVDVHPAGAVEIDGTFDEPSDDVWPLYQLTSHGATTEQCEEVAGRARAALLSSSIVVSGRSIGRWQVERQGEIIRADDVQPPIFMAPDRYAVFTTPS
jgi:hypothetical protein